MPSGVYANPPVVQITLEGEVVTRLRREAVRRDMSAVSLARAVLDTVVGDIWWPPARRRRPPELVDGPVVPCPPHAASRRPGPPRKPTPASSFAPPTVRHSPTSIARRSRTRWWRAAGSRVELLAWRTTSTSHCSSRAWRPGTRGVTRTPAFVRTSARRTSARRTSATRTSGGEPQGGGPHQGEPQQGEPRRGFTRPGPTFSNNDDGGKNLWNLGLGHRDKR